MWGFDVHAYMVKSHRVSYHLNLHNSSDENIEDPVFSPFLYVNHRVNCAHHCTLDPQDFNLELEVYTLWLTSSRFKQGYI